MEGRRPNALSLKRAAAFFGPNPYAPDPVIVCDLFLTDFDGPRLAEAFRAVAMHYPDIETGLERIDVLHEPALAIATLLANWTKSALNETCGLINRADAHSNGSGRATLWVGFHDTRTTRSALRWTGRALSSILRAPAMYRAETMAQDFAELQQRCEATHPSVSTGIMMAAARHRDIPFVPIVDGSGFWQFGWGARGETFFNFASNQDGMMGGHMAKSKPLSKGVFRQLGMPTPTEYYAASIDDLPRAIEVTGTPCVIKPANLGRGRGVTVGIETLPEAEAAFAHARTFTSEPILVERFVAGDDYRLMVLHGVLVAAVRCDPPAVCGDGRRTIAQLLAELNASRSPNIAKSGYLAPVVVDPALTAHLARQGLGLDSILEKGGRAALRGNANLSTGGTCADVLSDVNDEVRAMAESLAKTMGIASAGVDYVTADIRQPQGSFIEINATPGLYAAIVAGMSAEEIGSLALGRRPGRIPVILVIVPETVQPGLVDALRARAAARPGLGWLCGAEGGLLNMQLIVAPIPVPERPAVLLLNRATEHLILCWTIGELSAFGAPVDKADLAILLDVDLPDAWLRVVETVCPRVVRAQSLDVVFSACDIVLGSGVVSRRDPVGPG